MFGIGFTEIVIVALIALVIVGPDKLPEIAQYIGKLFSAFRRANLEIKQTISDVSPPDVMDIVEKRIKEEAKPPEAGLSEAGLSETPSEEKEDKKPEEDNK